MAIVKYDGSGDETSGESVNGGGVGGGKGGREKGLEGNSRTVYCLYLRRPDGFCVHVHTPFPSPPTHIRPVIRANGPYNIKF